MKALLIINMIKDFSQADGELHGDDTFRKALPYLRDKSHVKGCALSAPDYP